MQEGPCPILRKKLVIGHRSIMTYGNVSPLTYTPNPSLARPFSLIFKLLGIKKFMLALNYVPLLIATFY